MKSVVLLINTSSNKEIAVGLEIDGKDFFLRHTIDRKNQEVLPLIEKLLKDHKLAIKDIGEIRVNEGPGSFTGLRVGVSIANTLGYLLKIPVNGNKIGKMIEPIYK